MMDRSRRGLVALLLVASVCWSMSACSGSARYHTLKFFFDGVPDPNQAARVAEAPSTQPSEAGTPVAEAPSSKLMAFAHPLYRDNRCDECHDMLGGGLVRSVADGLCTMCHEQPPPGTEFVHEPVAKNECLSCHHYHASANPYILLDDPAMICFRCHKSDELSVEAHGAATDRQTCLDCHDPHGGADRFRLRTDKQ